MFNPVKNKQYNKNITAMKKTQHSITGIRKAVYLLFLALLFHSKGNAQTLCTVEMNYFEEYFETEGKKYMTATEGDPYKVAVALLMKDADKNDVTIQKVLGSYEHHRTNNYKKPQNLCV